ncbi:hypothetical protein DSECCO2_269660 [anaerobic digester metagenome]
MLPSELKVNKTPEDASVGETDVFQKQLMPLVLTFPLSSSILFPSCQFMICLSFSKHKTRSPVLLLVIFTCVGEVEPTVIALITLNWIGSIFNFNANLSNILSKQKAWLA